jgi:hypothetical protein
LAEKDSESRLQSKLDTKYLVENFGNYLEATPHEIQNIFSHISEQAIFSGFDQHWGTIENSRGYEHMLVLEKKHTRVEKRIFHTTYTEILFGVDFVLTKMTRKRVINNILYLEKQNFVN